MIQTNKTVAFYTLGCKLNFAETSTIGRQLKDQGMEAVDFDKGADLYVINTCSVTDNADKKCRAVIRQALDRSPGAFIVVIGCYAQLKPDEIAAIEGVDLVLGATEKFNLPSYLKDLTKRSTGEFHSCNVDEADHFIGGYSEAERTRAFLKVQDGCDYSCSFCTIPLARGKSRSATIESVTGQACELGERGIKEIVLTGVNTGDFGKGLTGGKQKEVTFLDLIRELDQVETVDRFRISSIEPNLVSDEIIEFVTLSNRFMPHFHIPLQSGSDNILRRMRRRYLSSLYKSRVEKIKEQMPHACIGVDVIVGFPGETEEEFMVTYNFLHELDVSYLHVFTYSERSDTHALSLDGVVPVEERRRRSKMLRNLSSKKRRQFNKQFEGSTREVLFEAKDEGGMISGYTDNYLKVLVPFDENLINQLKQVTLRQVTANGEVLGVMNEKVVL